MTEETKIDLAASGLIGEEPTGKEQEHLIKMFDEFFATIMSKLDQVEMRVTKCEKYCSYLLAKDPAVRERVEAIANAVGEKADAQGTNK